MSRVAAPSVASGSAPAIGSANLSSWPQGLRLLLRIRRTLRAEAGSSIVEFALASIILFALVFGVMAICFALYSYNVVSEAAREATRYAIVRGSACKSFASACPASQGDIQTYVQGLGFPLININTNPPSPALTAAASWPKGNNDPGSPVQVTVTYTFPLGIPFMPSRALTMSSTSQMTISQ
jgi:Flp pilus assembly protein TadG